MNKAIIFVAMFLAMSTVALAISVDWDKSTLVFTTTDSSCGLVSAHVCNNGSNMLGTTTYDVYFAATGNPKFGTIVDSGVIPALLAGECTDLTSVPAENGNYMFEAFQRPGHPGEGVLWSDSIAYDSSSCNVPEFGVIAGALALCGAIGIFIVRKH